LRVALYMDEPVAETGFRAMIPSDSGISISTCSSTPEELLAHLEFDAPDVVLLDLIPSISTRFIEEIRNRAPECKIVLWTREISTEWAYQAIELGVRGILSKTLPTELQLKCLHKVHEGELWLAKSLTENLLAGKPVALTRREGQLVNALARGLKNKEIAEVLGITEGTVKVYLSRLFRKVGVKDRFELALFGLKNINSTQQVPDGQRATANGAKTVTASGIKAGALRHLVVSTMQLAVAVLPWGVAVGAGS